METEETGRDKGSPAEGDEEERDVAASDALDQEPDYEPDDDVLKDLKGG